MRVNEFMTTTTASADVTVLLWSNDGLARCVCCNNVMLQWLS